jgi:hypothetical protein
MRSVEISLMSLAIATAGAGVASAQTFTPDFDGPISTGPLDYVEPVVTAPCASTVHAVPAVARPLGLTPSAAAAAGPPAPADPQTTETLTVAEETFEETEKVIELSDDATIGSRVVGAGEAGGGFLRTNPSIQRPDRKQLGVALKF